MHGGNGLDQIWVVVQYCRTSLVYVSWIQHCVQSRKARAKSKSLRHFRAKSNPLNTYQSPFKKPSKHYSCDEACLAMQCMLADCATRYASIKFSQGTVLTDWEKYIAGTSCTISASQHMQLQAKSQSLAFQYIAAAMLVSSALVVVWTTSELNLQHYSNTCAVQGGRLTILEIRSESSSTNQTDFPDNHNPYSNVSFMCRISYRIDQLHYQAWKRWEKISSSSLSLHAESYLSFTWLKCPLWCPKLSLVVRPNVVNLASSLCSVCGANKHDSDSLCLKSVQRHCISQLKTCGARLNQLEPCRGSHKELFPQKTAVLPNQACVCCNVCIPAQFFLPVQSSIFFISCGIRALLRLCWATTSKVLHAHFWALATAQRVRKDQLQAWNRSCWSIELAITPVGSNAIHRLVN